MGQTEGWNVFRDEIVKIRAGQWGCLHIITGPGSVDRRYHKILRSVKGTLLNALGRVKTSAQPSCNSQFGGAHKPPGEKHRDGLLVVTVFFTELGHKVFLFKVRAENNP